MSIVLNADDSFFSMVFAACSLAAAMELAIERTAEPAIGAAGTGGGPVTIAGRLFILGFLGFLGGFGCAHRTSGPMTWAFGRRPVCGTRLGETFFFVETFGIAFDYTRKMKKGRREAGLGSARRPGEKSVISGCPRSRPGPPAPCRCRRTPCSAPRSRGRTRSSGAGRV